MPLTERFIKAVKLAERQLTQKLIKPKYFPTESDVVTIDMMKRIEEASSNLNNTSPEEARSRFWLNTISRRKSEYLDLEVSIKQVKLGNE